MVPLEISSGLTIGAIEWRSTKCRRSAVCIDGRLNGEESNLVLGRSSTPARVSVGCRVVGCGFFELAFE